MHKIGLMAAVAAIMVASPVLAQEITVWDVNVDEPSNASYYDHAKSAFEAAHPGATLTFLSQPDAEYYTLLGTALASKTGPDVIWANGGAQAKNLVGGLIPLDDKLPDLISKLVGKSAFTASDGKLYFIPTTLQGHVVYYNKALYKAAGLDPDKPPTSWAEMTKVCDTFKAQGKTACFMMANKEGYEAEFFLSEMANQSLTARQQADWLTGKLHWSDAPVKAILQTWVDTAKDGWYQEGGNSQTMFMDEFTLFSQGGAGNVWGLLSNVAHWKVFEKDMGVDNVGVYPMPSPTVAADQHQGAPGVPLDGGVGYGVNKDSPNIKLALDAVKTLSSPEVLTYLVKDAGIVPANTLVDTSGIDSPGLKRIMGWLATSAVPTTHANSSAAELDEWHRQSQSLLNGDTTVDAAAAALDKVQAQAKPQ
ncbi:ABC transporter substrate-binding protein [Mesorhizobium kowhaii]|uniref:ABC transporter substrate-binding protein n=1 Tax=Mesorhizobium kowhaii TaxID=1300272 RepID=UPI0035E900E2